MIIHKILTYNYCLTPFNLTIIMIFTFYVYTNQWKKRTSSFGMLLKNLCFMNHILRRFLKYNLL